MSILSDSETEMLKAIASVPKSPLLWGDLSFRYKGKKDKKLALGIASRLVSLGLLRWERYGWESGLVITMDGRSLL